MRFVSTHTLDSVSTSAPDLINSSTIAMLSFKAAHDSAANPVYHTRNVVYFIESSKMKLSEKYSE